MQRSAWGLAAAGSLGGCETWGEPEEGTGGGTACGDPEDAPSARSALVMRALVSEQENATNVVTSVVRSNHRRPDIVAEYTPRL